MRYQTINLKISHKQYIFIRPQHVEWPPNIMQVMPICA